MILLQQQMSEECLAMEQREVEPMQLPQQGGKDSRACPVGRAQARVALALVKMRI